MADFLEMRNAMLRVLLSDNDEDLEQELLLLPEEDIVPDKIPAPEPI